MLQNRERHVIAYLGKRRVALQYLVAKHEARQARIEIT